MLHNWKQKEITKKKISEICVCVWGGQWVNVSLKKLKFNKAMGNGSEAFHIQEKQQDSNCNDDDDQGHEDDDDDCYLCSKIYLFSIQKFLILP